MAMPHFKYDLIKRSQGCNILATLSYQSRSRIRDYSDNNLVKKSYTHNEDLKEFRLFLPEGSPERYKNHEILWNEINDHCNDRLIIRCQLPRQREMKYEHFIECADRFFFLSGGQYNCPYEFFVHQHKLNNDNDHIHGMIALNPITNGEISTKSKKVYVDENNNEIKMVDDSPVLTRKGQLIYNKDGSYKTKKGYQVVDKDKNGNIQYDENGKVKVKDIRVALYDDNGKRLYYGNGKYKKPAWKEAKVRLTGLETLKDFNNKKGYRYEARMLWQDCINEIYKKYDYRNEKGELLQVDLRSYEVQDKDKPDHEKRLAGEHIGHDPGSEEKIERNEIRKKINAGNEILEPIPYDDLQIEYEIKQASKKAAELTIALKDRKNKNEKTEKKKEQTLKEQEIFFKQMDPRKRYINSVIKRTGKNNKETITAAGLQYDRMTNKDRVAFVQSLYGEDVAIIASRVLNRTYKDNTNALDGLAIKDVNYLFDFEVPKTFTEHVVGIFDKVKNTFSKTPEKPQQQEFNKQLEFERDDNIGFYLKFPEVLKEKAREQATEAEKILNYSAAMNEYTKKYYYNISDTCKIFKEYLQIRLMLKTKMPLTEIEKLRSKEFETLCKNKNLKKEFADYDKWLRLSQQYYSHLSEEEKKKPGRPAALSKTFINSIPFTSSPSDATTGTDRTTSRAGTTIDKSETEKSKSILPTSRTPNLNIKWQDKKDRPTNEMEKAEQIMEEWAKGMEQSEVLPPDPKRNNNSENKK